MHDEALMVVWGDRELTRPAARPCAENAYQSEAYVSAFQEVREGLRRGEALIVLTGESGTGKTLLCRALIEMGDPRTFTSFVVDPCESPEGLLLQILSDFGVVEPSARMTRDEALRVLQRFLASLAPVRSRALVIIDEAHRLQPDVAELLRVLSNVEANGQRLLHVVLAGLPELDTILQRPEMRRLAQRVSRHVEMTPLAAHEIAGYVEHRLSFAGGAAGWQEHVVLESGPGYSGVITVQVPGDRAADLSNIWFTNTAIRAVHRTSNGVPAVVNALFDRAVTIASERQICQVDRAVIREAAMRVAPKPAFALPRVTRRAGIAAAVVATVIVTGAAAWARAGGSATTGAAQEVARFSAPAAAPQLPLAVDGGGAVTASPVQTASSLTISIASFRTEERARAVAAQLVDAGFPAFVRPRGDGLWQQVIVGPYVSREEAAAAQRAMAAQGVTGTEVRLERTELQP